MQWSWIPGIKAPLWSALIVGWSQACICRISHRWYPPFYSRSVHPAKTHRPALASETTPCFMSRHRIWRFEVSPPCRWIATVMRCCNTKPPVEIRRLGWRDVGVVSIIACQAECKENKMDVRSRSMRSDGLCSSSVRPIALRSKRVRMD